MSGGYWLTAFCLLLFAHWLGDFVLQTHWQASNKSRDNRALLAHVATYILLVGLSTLLIAGLYVGYVDWTAWAGFVVVNAVLHFATDYVTSRSTSRLFAEADWHNFFVVVGLDQLIHQVTLAATFYYFFGPTP